MTQRATPQHPCQVCGGDDQRPRGSGERCVGFVTDSGAVAYCTRPDKAGGLALDTTTEPEAYPHRLRGDCGCGVVHGEAEPRVASVAAPRGSIEATYPYRDAAGELRYEVVRFRPKDFRPRRPDGRGGWSWNLKGVDRIPYRLPEVVAAPPGVVWVAEGERDADRLAALGLVATTCPGGAGKWRESIISHLPAEGTYVIVRDNDKAGLDGGAKTARLFAATGREVRILDLPGLAEHGDVSDWLDEGGDPASLEALVAATEPFIPAPPGGNGNGNGHGPDAEEPRARGLYSDARNGERFAAMHGGRALFDCTRGYWRIWDETRWGLDVTAQVILLAHEVIGQMHSEVDAVSDTELQQKLRRQVVAVEALGRTKAMIEEAKSLLPATHETFDTDPYLLNTLSGVVNLRTGELLPHRPDLWQSKLAPVQFDPDAKCPIWDAFLDRVLGGDDDLIAFFQRAVGLSLIGEVREHVLFIMWGGGANGKSVATRAIQGMLGDYGRTASPDLLLHHENPQHPTAIAELQGVRFVSAVETDQRAKLAESMVKALTGGDARSARFMRMDNFTYEPSDTVWLSTNHKPAIQSVGEGIWRRLRLIPFSVEIPKAEQDRDLPAKLRAEYPGILAWAVRGSLEVLRDGGLGFSTAVDKATASYKTEQDSLADFINDYCYLDENVTTLSSELYQRYQTWAVESGERAVSQRIFGLRLTERGFPDVRVGHANRHGRRGIGVDTFGTFGGN